MPPRWGLGVFGVPRFYTDAAPLGLILIFAWNVGRYPMWLGNSTISVNLGFP